MKVTPAKDFTIPTRGALNRKGSTVDTTKPVWKAPVGMTPKKIGSNVKSTMKGN